MKKIFVSTGFALLASAGSAFAALDLTGVEANTSDVGAIMALVVPALMILWGYRKVVKTANRS
jgi:hypothetical protein